MEILSEQVLLENLLLEASAIANHADKIILSKLYPKISSFLNSNTSKFKRLVAGFLNDRAKEIHEIAPFNRIVFSLDDAKKLFDCINISEQEVINIISNTYYYPIANFNPKAAKDPFTVTLLTIIRYFVIKNKKKEAELATIYLSFSGKFYPSLHYSSFPKVEPAEHRSVMEYAVNNKLSQQFDLKREGSLFGAMRSRGNTWLNKYKDRFKDFDDGDVVYIIQQLHDRIKSFMQNIASVYYEVYDNKDAYLNYESDSLGEEDYRIADNDMYKIERATEQTMQRINGVNADYALCKLAVATNKNVRTDELKNIIELILQDNHNLLLIKELCRILITLYFASTDKKDLHDIGFISNAISLRPNTKDKNVLRQKEIVEKLLDENSTAYRKRKKRLATKNSYNRAILSYFALIIYNANK